LVFSRLWGRRKMAMKRMLLVAVASVVVVLVLGSVALAQGTTPMAETTPGPLAPSGGMSILLPAAALLMGAGVLTYAVLRRRM
jgi:hypothetical protein